MTTVGRSREPGAGADLWLLEEAAMDGFSARVDHEHLLSDDELARLERLRHPHVRRRFLAGRVLCRHALSTYADVTPDEWRFTLGRFGRPEIEHNPWGLVFNLSHTAGLLACVVTRHRACGVDVERTPAAPGAVALAEQHFACEERAHLRAAPAAVRPARFVDYWVLKESYAKALGVGLSRRLDGFSFNALPTPVITVHDRERDAGESARWQFALLRIATGHACGVALRRDVDDRHVVAVRRADAQVLMDGRGGRPAMREAGGPVERVPPILNGEPLDKDSE